MSSTVDEVVDGRDSVYGAPIIIYTRIAQMWSALLDHEIQPYEVPLMMMCLKLVRTVESPRYSDNSDDIEGYLDIFRQLIGSDMVHARSVEEYLRKRDG